MNDHELAHSLATEAGALLLEVRLDDSADRGAEGDRRSQDLLARRLREERPDEAVLSEEPVDDRRRLTARRVWIIDALDGTREFADSSSDWAVHVALWDSGWFVAGALALPAHSVTLSSPVVRLVARQSRKTRIVVSRTRPPRFAEDAARTLDADLVPLGSAGAKVAAIIQGDADVYIHASGQHEWDSAAPVVVAPCAGLHASRIDGSLLAYNQPDPSLPDLLVCRVQLAATVLEAIP